MFWRCCLLLALGFTLFSVQADKSKPTKIVLNNWSSQLVLSYIVGDIITRMGQPVEYLHFDINQQWGALSRNRVHIQVEVWQGTMDVKFRRLVKQGRVIDAGSYDAITREDWWYPLYVEQLCPGLPDWKALRQCAHLFRHDGSGKLGRYIAGPWDKPDGSRIRALDLAFLPDRVGHGDDLWLELKTAQANHQAIVLFNWTPNWIEDVYEGRFVEFPKFHPDCETNPAWGVNTNATHDCGNPAKGWLKKAVSNSLASDNPCAYQLIKNMNLANKDFSHMAALVDYHKMQPQDAAKQWLNRNVNLWQDWLGQGCQLISDKR